MVVSAPDTSDMMVQGVKAILHVVRSDLPEAIRAGDQFALDGMIYAVSKPDLDEGRVTWVLQCVDAPEPNRAAKLLQKASKA